MWKTRERSAPGTDAPGDLGPDSGVVMYARTVEETALRLRELDRSAREELGLAALALGLAIAATVGWPDLAMPLFLGGLGVGALGMRALWRHWDILDRLVDERDAYVIPEVRTYASREASMKRRASLASQLRAMLEQPHLGGELRALGVVEDLDAIATQLADDRLALDPVAAVACRRLLCEPGESPLFDSSRRSAELRARIRDIRSGFSPLRLAA